MQFGNLFSRAYPELLARHNELGLIQHAREAEQNILTRIGDASTAVTTSSLIGFGRDFLVQIKRAAAAYRSRHRIAPETQLRAIIPAWVIDAMSADLTLAMPGDNTISVGASEINGYLASSNVSLVASLDQNVFGAPSTGGHPGIDSNEHSQGQQNPGQQATAQGRNRSDKLLERRHFKSVPGLASAYTPCPGRW
jgi:hypothetical protein